MKCNYLRIKCQYNFYVKCEILDCVCFLSVSNYLGFILNLLFNFLKILNYMCYYFQIMLCVLGFFNRIMRDIDKYESSINFLKYENNN